MSFKYTSNAKEVKNKLTGPGGAYDRALDTIGHVAVSRAAFLCPVDTGLLKSSINHKVELKDLEVSVGTPVVYGPVVEFGLEGQRAQPFIEPGIMQNIEVFKWILSQELKQL